MKKLLSPTRALSPPQTADDEELMDDLLAQLDSRDQSVHTQSATVLHDMQLEKAADDIDAAPKQDSKSRHKARQVRFASTLVAHSLS